MERVRAIFASLFAVLLLSVPRGISSATTCIDLPPLKPEVLQAGKEIAAQESNNDGKFAFDHLEAGKYEIRVHFAPLRVAATEVVLIHPEAKPKREIAVNLTMEGCSGSSLVHAKKFKAGLNPASS